MRIRYHKQFIKHYQKRIAPFPSLENSFRTRLTLFIKEPNHPLLRDHKLIGNKSNVRAFSVTGDVRVVYRKIENEIQLLDIGTHNQVY